MVGLDSAAGGSPALPGESPLLLGVLGWARKASEETATGEDTATARAAVLTTSEIVDEAAVAPMAFASLEVANTPPVVTDTRVDLPVSGTGAVSGAVTATDQDGDALTFSLSGGQPAAGSVTVNTNGTFTFTPTVAARFTAAGTAGPDTDSFMVSVSDGTNTTTTQVSVPVSAADLSTPTIFGGTGVDPFEMVIVGNRLYLANQGSNTVTVYDTATTAAVKTITVGARPTGSRRQSRPDQGLRDQRLCQLGVGDRDRRQHRHRDHPRRCSAVSVTISPDGTRLFVANSSGNTVSVVNTTTSRGDRHGRRRLRPERHGDQSGRLAALRHQHQFQHRVGHQLRGCRADGDDDHCSGDAPSSVAVSSTRAVVTNQSAGSVTVLDTTTATPTVLATIALATGAGPTSVVFSKDGTVAFVANSDDTVSVIVLARPVPTLVRTVAIDSTPAAGAHSLALSADGTRLYVSDAVDRLVRIVDTTATLQRTTVSVTAGATATSIFGGIEAANLGALVNRVDVVGADPSDLVQYRPVSTIPTGRPPPRTAPPGW